MSRPSPSAPLGVLAAAAALCLAGALPIAAKDAGGVTGAVTHGATTVQMVAGYGFVGLDDGSGNPPAMMFLTAAPLNAKKIAAKPHAGARTVEIANQAAAEKVAMLVIWEENPGQVMVRFVPDGDFFGTSHTETVMPVYATLEELPWPAPTAGRLVGSLTTADASSSDGLTFEIEFDVEMMPMK